MNIKSLFTLRKTLLYFIFFIFIHSLNGQALERDSLSVSRFGKVFIYKQPGIQANVIILISGDSGWNDGIVEFAKSFVDKNTIVIGVDILTYYSQLRPRRKCVLW